MVHSGEVSDAGVRLATPRSALVAERLPRQLDVAGVRLHDIDDIVGMDVLPGVSFEIERHADVRVWTTGEFDEERVHDPGVLI